VNCKSRCDQRVVLLHQFNGDELAILLDPVGISFGLYKP